MFKKIAILFGLVLFSSMALGAYNPASIPVVPTIAAMQALGAASAQYGTVSVKQYSTAVNGGGGIFNWDAASVATVDGGTVFTATGVVTGRWLRQGASSAPINVQMFGAVCDNSTNDATALQNAENAAYTLGTAIVFPYTGNLCRTNTTLTPKSGVDHYCVTGQNFGDSGSGSSLNCGIYANVSTNCAYLMQNANGTSGVQSPTWHDMYITSTGCGVQLNSIAGGFTDDNTTQAAMMYPKMNRVTIAAGGGFAFQCSKCFYLEAIGGQWNGTGTNTLDLQGSDNSTISGVNFAGFTTQNINLRGRSTFGNSNTIQNSQITCPFTGGSACITNNSRSSRILNNFIECQGALMPAAIIVGDAVSSQVLQSYIENNVIDCGPSFATNGLVVNAQPYLFTYLNNASSGTPYASALWNGGTGTTYWINPTNAIQIFHSGNSNEGGMPMSSYNNFPEYSGQDVPGLLASFTPGATSFNVTPTGYGLTVKVSAGGWILPNTGSGNVLTFNQLAGQMVGTLDICMLTSGSTDIVLTALDNVTSKGTASPATTARIWTCVLNQAYATGAIATITGGATAASIYQVIVRQNGI